MIKFRWYYDIDAEEEYLNKMSRKGYYLESYKGGFYKFKKIKETDYTYRVDLVSNKSQEEVQEYIDLVRESGAKLIQNNGVWIYFRKKGDFKLYTDVDSQLDFYNRIKKMFYLLGLGELAMAIGQCCLYFSIKSYFNLFAAIFIGVIAIVFLFQTHKIDKKINELEKKKI